MAALAHKKEVRRIVESNGKDKYKPKVEFEKEEDVNLWIRKDDEGTQKIVYPDELLEKWLQELDEDDQSEPSPDN